MGNMGSAHPLVEVNVSFKFEGNPSISKGVIERTRIGDGPTDRLLAMLKVTFEITYAMHKYQQCSL